MTSVEIYGIDTCGSIGKDVTCRGKDVNAEGTGVSPCGLFVVHKMKIGVHLGETAASKQAVEQNVGRFDCKDVFSRLLRKITE